MQTDHPSHSTKQAITHSWADSLWFRILLLTALGLGVFFRFAGLGYKIYSHDEAYASLRAAGYHKGDLLTAIRDGKDHPVEEIRKFLQPGPDRTITDTLFITAQSGPHQAPLFYLLAHVWMRLIGDTAAAMRGLAALFGLLSIPAMYWLSRELFRSPRVALLSTALFAISPFHILFSQDARPYSLWTLASLLASAALLRARRKNDFRSWLLYSLTLVLGMYSHQLFILVVLAHGFYIAGMYFLQRKNEYGMFLLACLFAFLAYLPWLFMVIRYWNSVVEGMDWLNRQTAWQQYIKGWALIFSSPFIDFDFNSGNLIPYLLRALALGLIACSFVFLVWRGSLQEKMFVLSMFIIPAGAFLGPDLLMGGMRSISGRYFVPVSMTSILVVAYFLASRLEQTRNSLRWKFLIGLLLLGGILSNVNSMQAESWWNKELGRVRPEFVHEIDKDQALLIVSIGHQGTTIGDVLLLSLGIDSDVHFRLADDPEDLKDYSMYDHVYWFPSSFLEVQKAGLQVTEILPGTLWRIQNEE